MAIRGSLSEFSVPEILQLLALQQKSGVLALSHAGDETLVMFFERGKVLAAAERRQVGRNAFLGHLSDNLMLTADQQESVEDICQATGHDLFTVLVSSGVLGRDRLQEEMRRFAQLRVDDVVGWREGSYEFSGDEKSLPSQGITVKLNPEELLLESMRRGDELATLKESMLAPDLLLAKVRNADSVPLPHDGQMVLTLVNGARTIEEICAESPLGDYLTYDAISDLLSTQQIMIVDPAQAVHLIARRARRTPITWSPIFAAISLVVGSALFGVGLEPLLHDSRGDTGWLSPEAIERRAEVRVHLEHDVAALRETLGRDR